MLTLAPHCPVLSEDSILLASALSSRRKSEAWTWKHLLNWLDDSLFTANLKFCCRFVLLMVFTLHVYWNAVLDPLGEQISG